MLVVFLASVLAGFAGFLWLRKWLQQRPPQQPPLVTATAASAVPRPAASAPALSVAATPAAAPAPEPTATTGLRLRKEQTRDIKHLGELKGARRSRTTTPGALPHSTSEDGDEEPLAPDAVASHPVYCPVPPPLSAEQDALLAQLRQRVAPVMIEHYARDPTVYVRFMRARQWSLDKAEAMLRDAITWRQVRRGGRRGSSTHSRRRSLPWRRTAMWCR